MQKMDFGIVNYNGGNVLIECIESLLVLECPKSINVFDNASTDGSLNLAKEKFPEVNFIESTINLGYAGAINRLVQNFQSEFSVLMNMDLTLDPKWPVVIQSVFESQTSVDSIASLVLETGNPPLINSGGIRFYKDLHPQSIGSGKEYTGREIFEKNVCGAYGALMVFRRRVFEELLFDEDYFLFFEETDFYLRFILSGKQIVFEQKALAYHYRSFATKRYSLNKLFLSERNRVRTLIKLCPIWYWPIAQLHTLNRFLKMSKQKPVGNEKGAVDFPSKFQILQTLLKAWVFAYLGMPQLIKKRRAFFNRIDKNPSDTLKLMNTYALDSKDLSMR